jgi:hypothetical protein
MYLGTLKTIAIVDHCYDEISHILIAASELPFEENSWMIPVTQLAYDPEASSAISRARPISSEK